jgi:serine phosphatase RsbU (regulator of sigma subunit)
MEFLSRGTRPPDEELFRMMASIGNQISQFIERRQAERQLRRQEEDRRIARQIQQALLPRATPTFAGLRVRGRSSPANVVGGDCFDFIPLPAGEDGRLGIVVADASGHGIGAALLMAETRAYLRALSLTCPDVSTLLALTNRRLASDQLRDHFVTVFLLLLDPRDGSLVYSSAGHCAGHLLDRQGQTRAVLASTALPLGIDPAAAFPTGPRVSLGPGELLFLFTDGIVEAGPPEGGQFGLERALGIVRAHRHEAPEAILEALFGAVTTFSGQQLRDDLTAVILQADDTAIIRPPRPAFE